MNNNTTKSSAGLLNLEYIEDNVTYMNSRCWFEDNDGIRVVFLCHIVLFRIVLGDEFEIRMYAVLLHQGGYATQKEIARAFGHSLATQKRWEAKYKAEGLKGLERKPKSGRPCEITRGQLQIVKRWFQQGLSNREMARKLGLSEKSIRNMLKKLNLKRAEKNEMKLPFSELTGATTAALRAVSPVVEVTKAESSVELSASSLAPAEAVEQREEAPIVLSLDTDPEDRTLDRLLASQGLLNDAAPLFADANAVPRAGALLAIPLLVNSGVLSVFQKLYGSIGPAFYGLRTSVVCLVMLALLRIKRPENVKEYNPRDLGRIFGLDRVPEVKTIRRKLSELAKRGKGAELMLEMAQQRVALDEERIGFLYFDGHVKEYHGKFELGKTHIAVKRIAAPASTDTWVNDSVGDPLFVVTSELNAGLTRMLKPMLSDIQARVGKRRQLTAVFDRGGFSPMLFLELRAMGVHIITYRKGGAEQLNESDFKEAVFEAAGKLYRYRLNDNSCAGVGVKQRQDDVAIPELYMRQVTKLSTDGTHQTQVLTTRHDLTPAEVLYRMFSRWRQENYFKYMLAEFDLDALSEYGIDDLSPDADRPNPELKKLQKQLNKAHSELDMLRLAQVEYENSEYQGRNLRRTQVATKDLPKSILTAQAEVERLTATAAKLPKRVSADPLRQLRRERKLVVNAIKLTAYQLESDLTRMLNGLYSRVEDEGRTLLHAAFQSSADIRVIDDKLEVILSAQSSAHRSESIKQLCTLLTAQQTTFPGTDLRLTFSVSPHPK